MSRYETFVIRLWVKDEDGLGHGEVKHLTTGTGLHFLKVDEALDFIKRFTEQYGRGATDVASVTIEAESNCDGTLVDFGSTTRKG